MNDETWNVRQDRGERGLQSRGRRGEAAVLAEVADNVHHADLPDAPAPELGLGGGRSRSSIGRGVVAAPDAEAGLAGAPEGGEGVADGGGGGERPQRGLPEAEVGHGVGQQSNGHAKGGGVGEVRNVWKGAVMADVTVMWR